MSRSVLQRTSRATFGQKGAYLDSSMQTLRDGHGVCADGKSAFLFERREQRKQER
jgi:hypothetical protein